MHFQVLTHYYITIKGYKGIIIHFILFYLNSILYIFANRLIYRCVKIKIK